MEWHTEMKDVITNLKPKNTENEGGWGLTDGWQRIRHVSHMVHKQLRCQNEGDNMYCKYTYF